MRFIFVLFASLFVLSCSTRNQPMEKPLARKPDLAKDSLDQTKTPAQVRKRNIVQGTSDLAYFASIQILSEIVVTKNCETEMGTQSSVEEDYLGSLNQDRQLSLSSPRAIQSVFNLNLRSLGFDQLRYRLSVVNGRSEVELPYQIQLTALPSNQIQLNYLSQTINLDPAQTPILTFSVPEKRGDCELTHNVNIFAENAGRVELAARP